MVIGRMLYKFILSSITMKTICIDSIIMMTVCVLFLYQFSVIASHSLEYQQLRSLAKNKATSKYHIYQVPF